MLVTHDNNLLLAITLYLFQGKENTFNEPDSSTESNISDIFAEYAVLPGIFLHILS